MPPRLLLGLSAGVISILVGMRLEPIWRLTFGEARDLSRFSESTNTLTGLVALLVFSWVFAAVGEELAFRGLVEMPPWPM